MARRDRKCICCESKYKYCPTCSQDKSKPSYLATFCGEECMTLWTTATKYNMEMLTKPEAKEIIESLELKEKSAYVACVQRDLEVILEPEVVIEEATQVEDPTSKRIKKSHGVVTKEKK